jgi:serine/threonine-protein kinase
LVDRYAIQEEVGSGGMAIVFRAFDLKHERNVAVKVLRPEIGLALGPDRFLQEIKTTAQLSHPNILSLLDSGECDGLLYYVMPYVEGETLRERMQREKQLSYEDAQQIILEVGDALSYAHSRDVLHKPGWWWAHRRT